MTNCIIAGFGDSQNTVDVPSNKTTYAPNFNFQYCVFDNPFITGQDFFMAIASGAGNQENLVFFSHNPGEYDLDTIDSAYLIDAGLDTTSSGSFHFSPLAFDFDVDGDPRKNNGAVDIGAQEK